ncbi:MAG: protein kinase [Deltaproteobacteria bacterium]|nr:protein kinase [Deltaproteobacteria bacterium]
MAGPGRYFGPFELLRNIGEGANGEVWEALRAHGERPTAVKLLTSSSADARARFFRECRVVLDHPHIVRVLDHGEAEGTPWLELELLQGETLHRRMTSRTLRLPDAVEVARQAASALAHAHARGITHRDLKPENMMLLAGHALHVKILDFGLARILDEAGVTRTGTAVGTALYMSPEQVMGLHGVDMRSDLWSLGVILYELLTGACPFRADTVLGTLYKILQEPVPALPDGLSDELCGLVRALLSKDPAHRPNTDETLAALERVPVATVSRLPAPVDALSPTETFGDEGLLLMAMDPAMLSDERTQAVLVSVVFFRRTRDPRPVTALAETLGGRCTQLLRDSLLVVFGHLRWKGDEPERAVRLAAALSGCAEAVGVATGRVLRFQESLVGVVAHLAASLATAPGVAADATTVALLRGRFAWGVREDGSAHLEVSAPAQSLGAPEETAPFLGRDGERTQLLDLVREARDACALTGVVITGSLGMGKSRLRRVAQRALREELPEALVLEVRCDPLRAHSPFSAWREALSGVVDALLLEQLDPSVSGSSDPQATLDRIRGSLDAALRDRASRGPLVLSVDDAQWLDAASTASLRWLVQSAPELPLALWLFATPDASEALRGALPAPNVRQLDVLPEVHARKVLQHFAPEMPEALLARAGGHPLFLEELGRLYAAHGAMPAQLPPTLAVALHAALDRLAPSQQEFLKRSPLCGRTAPRAAVEALGGDPNALEPLLAARVLVRRSPSRFAGCQQFAFRSGAPQEAALRLWPDVQRAGLLESAGQWLATRPEVTQAELGDFWERAGDLRRAATHLAAAAEASARVADAATTLALTDRVLGWLEERPPESVDRALQWRQLVARDDALQLSAQRVAQQRGLEKMARLARELPPEASLELACRESYACRMRNDLVGATAHGIEAVALAEALDSPRYAALAHVELVYCYTEKGGLDHADRHAAMGLAEARRTGEAWLLGRALTALGFCATEQGRLGESLVHISRAADLFSSTGDLRREALALNNLGNSLLRLGRLEEATDVLKASATRSAKVGNPRTRLVARHNLAIILRMTGDMTEAAKIADEVEPQATAMKHHYLNADITIERVYHMLHGGGSPGGEQALPEAAAGLRRQLTVVSIPSLASGLLLAWAQIEARSGHAAPDCSAAITAALAEGKGGLEAQATLAVARTLLHSQSPETLAEADRRIDAFTACASAPGEVASCRAALFARLGVAEWRRAS